MPALAHTSLVPTSIDPVSTQDIVDGVSTTIEDPLYQRLFFAAADSVIYYYGEDWAIKILLLVSGVFVALLVARAWKKDAMDSVYAVALVAVLGILYAVLQQIDTVSATKALETTA